MLRCSPRSLLLAVSLAACSHGTAAAPTPGAPTAAAQPPLAAITTDEEYSALRGEYDALDVGDPRRPPRRAALSRWLLGQVERELKAGRPDGALEPFKQALTLYDAVELDRARGAAKLDDPALARAAESVEVAFRPRGGHEAVLIALAAQRALRPDDPGPQGRWAVVVDWMASADELEDGPRHGLAEDLRAVVAAWPAPFVVEELARLYEKGDDPIAALGRRKLRGSDLSQLLAAHSGPPTSYRLAALYLRVSRPDAAAAAIRKLGEPRAGIDGDVRQLVESYVAKEATPRNAVELAALFFRSRDDQVVTERVCRDAARRFATSAEPWLCVGEAADHAGRLAVAIRALEEAKQREPTRWETWDSLARLYQNRLLQLASDERLGDLVAELARVEKFHAEARARFPDRPLRASVAGAYVEVARGYYNGGRIDEAVRYCKKSLSVEPSAEAYEQLASIDHKRGRHTDSIAHYRRALETLPRDIPAALKHAFRAKLGRGLADALEGSGDKKGADGARRIAVVEWEAVLRDKKQLTREGVAEAELDRSRLLYQLGHRDNAMAALHRAIDAQPDRGSTYADALSFLVPRGERDEAVDAYHRALGRAEVSEYLKVYCSLWMMDLDRRAGEPEDPLARAFLEGLDGGKWYHELARWAVGRIDDAQLEARADTPGKKAESAFYRGMRLVAAGKREEGTALLRKVLDTQMMGFFEYDMASYYLRHPEALKTSPRAAAR